MSLITQQTLLQARDDRDDALRRISIGEDTQKVRDLLAGANKRITKLEAQMKTEVAAAEAKRQAAADKAAKDNDKRGPRQDGGKRKPSGDRPPLPEDQDVSCQDCSNCFSFSGKDQVFYAKNGWNPPVRCADCREAKKNAKPSGTSIPCVDCKTEFFFTAAKARVFETKGWAAPKRCNGCRAKRSDAASVKSGAKTTSA
jgi:hypothetical protein